MYLKWISKGTFLLVVNAYPKVVPSKDLVLLGKFNHVHPRTTEKKTQFGKKTKFHFIESGFRQSEEDFAKKKTII